MIKISTNGHNNYSLRKTVIKLAEESDQLLFAVAFFNEKTLVEKWLDSEKTVSLIISLRWPTDYYVLKELLHRERLKIFHYRNRFHSKIYCFFKGGEIHASIIGSSNFTNGGLETNIETNVLIEKTGILDSIENQLNHIKNGASILQPNELEDYKEEFDRFRKANKKRPTKKTKSTNGKNQRVPTKDSGYIDFWKVADRVKYLIQKIADKRYPTVPTYLVLDHFWHWIVQVCDQDKLERLKKNRKIIEKQIPVLFKEYCDWDKKERKYTKLMLARSNNIQSLLSKNNISKLTIKQAMEVYSSFHATRSIMQRFDADDDFLTENSINDIRRTFKYILYSKDAIQLRIHNSISINSKYKLVQFGASCVQELIGWFYPKKYPIRNNKADKAIKLLGYRS